jgi:hypothetical protein
MPRDDDSFWLAIFKKSPLIASIMALGGVIGLCFGLFLAQSPVVTRHTIQWFSTLVAGTTFGGIFIGLILGVIVDSVWNAIRGNKKRKPPRDI